MGNQVKDMVGIEILYFISKEEYVYTVLRYLLREECNISICISPPFQFFFFSLTPMVTKLVLNKKCERVDPAALVDKGSRQTVGSKE